MKKIALILLVGFCLTGCQYLSGVTPPTPQGNALTQDALAQLKVGLYKDEVRYLLGHPMLPNTANENQWEYVYTFQSGYQPLQTKHLTLFFKNGRLHSWKQK